MNSIFEKFKNPAIAALVAVVVGFAFGLLWGWKIQPVVWTDTAPDILNSTYQEDYLRMTVDSFAENGDADLAFARWKSLGANAQTAFEAVQLDPQIQDPAKIEGFGVLMISKAEAGSETVTPADPEPAPDKETSPWTKYLFIALGVVAVGAVAYFAIRLFRPAIGGSGEATPIQKAQEMNRSSEKTDYTELGLANPIVQTMTSYVLGDDLYDESFSIEAPSGEFMGEFGVGIAETIGIGDPKKVAALEVWLFDQNDIKTATKVLMTENAYHDAAVRQKLEAKGELVMVEPNKKIIIETETLQLLVTVTDLEYGAGPLPPNSFLDRAILELAIWPKS